MPVRNAGVREDPVVNSIRWGVTGERAMETRSPEPKGPPSGPRRLETTEAKPLFVDEKNGDGRKSRTGTSHDWRQNGRKRW
jgi:hypothetical protein